MAETEALYSPLVPSPSASGPAKVGTPIAFDILADYRGREPTAVNTLLAARGAMIWTSRSLPQRVVLLLRFSEWVTKIPLQAIGQVARHGPAARRAGSGSLPRQLASLLRLVARCRIEPKDFYAAGLYLDPATAALAGIIPYSPYATVVNALTAASDQRLFGIRDKQQFAELCQTLGLPCVPTLARFETSGTGPAGLPDHDIIVKPRRGGQGKGIEVWRRTGSGYTDGRETLSAPALAARLQELARSTRAGLLIQPVLVNHPDLAIFGSAALATTRVCTVRNETGEPEIVEAFLRIGPRAGAIVDNYHAGGLLYPVEVGSGRLAPGISESSLAAGRRTTGQPPAPAHPHFPAVADLALRAHRALPGLVLAGWDVAVTPDGPVLVEVNIPHGISVGRQVGSRGFAGSRLMELVAWHARGWLRDNLPATSRWQVGANRDPSRRG